MPQHGEGVQDPRGAGDRVERVMAANGQVHTEEKAGVAKEKGIIRNTRRITPLPPQKTLQTQQVINSQKRPEKGCIAEVN